MSAVESIASLIKVTGNLSTIIQKETLLLRNHQRPLEMKALQAEKIKLTESYESQFKTIGERSQQFFEQAPEEMNALNSVIHAFRQTLDDHNRALFAAKTVTERMIRAVTREVAKKDQPLQGYAKYPSTATKPVQAKRPISIAFNELV